METELKRYPAVTGPLILVGDEALHSGLERIGATEQALGREESQLIAKLDEICSSYTFHAWSIAPVRRLPAEVMVLISRTRRLLPL